MASIYKRGDTWWVHYSVGGKDVSRSLRTKHERIALEAKRRLEALDLVEQLPQPSSTRIETVLQSFAEFLLRTRTCKSAKNDIAYLRSFFGTCCPALELGTRVPRKYRTGDRPLPKVKDRNLDRHVPVRRLEQVSAELINEFIRRRLVEDHVSPKTANRIREILHRLFSYAAEHHGYVCPDRRYRNPVEGVRRAKEPAPVIRWLKTDEIQQQLDVLKDRPVLRAMVATYIYAGLRREEAMWLTPEDVDLEARLIRVRAKSVAGKTWQPKTRRNRVVPVSEGLLTILKEYQPQSGRTWFFPSPAGMRWDPDNFSQGLREANGAHGLEWTCLDFRHTFGSHLAQKGESLYKIATLMGNSPEVCRRHSAALVPEAMHDAVEFSKPSPVPASNGNGNLEALLQEVLGKLNGRGEAREAS